MYGSVLPSFASVQGALDHAGSGADAAELHGSLCGFVCACGNAARVPWLASLGEEGALQAAGPELLGELAAVTWEALEQGNMGFTPLLPEDSETLNRRADSLAHWCQGFTGGLASGLLAGGGGADLPGGVTGEILADLSELARAAFAADEAAEDAGEGAEEAYAELVEFVRVSVQLLFEELTPLRERLQGLSSPH